MVGQAIGLLTGTGAEDVGLDEDWVSEPTAKLEALPQRLGSIASLLATVLAPAEDGPPVFEDAGWYPLPSVFSEDSSAAHLVATAAPSSSPRPAATQLGIGLLSSIPYGAAIRAAAYLPLVARDASGTRLSALRDPIQLLLEIPAPAGGRFQGPSGETYAGVTLELRIHLTEPPQGSVAFTDLQGADDGKYSSLSAVLADERVMQRIATAVSEGAQPWLHTYPGNAPPLPGNKLEAEGEDDLESDFPPTIGDLLVRAGLLTPSLECDFAGIGGKTPRQLVLDLLQSGAEHLAGLEFPLIGLPGGGVFVERTTDGRYGVRATTRVSLGGGKRPEVDLCVGQWMSGEERGADWMTKAGAPADPGLSLLLLSPDGDGLKLEPSFELNSLGVDVRGAAGAPLLDLGSWSLAGVELRGSISSDGHWGAAARVDQVGMPLGPNFESAQGAGGNAVARTLVAGGGEGPSPESSTVNPAFSLEAGYASGHSPFFELVDPGQADADLIWFPVQKRFGPLDCRKVGLRLDMPAGSGAELDILFDGGVELGPLAVDLDELSLGVRLHEAGHASGYGIDLQGLAIAFSSGGVEIDGGLIKAQDAGAVAYDGEALIEAEGLAISALASFGSLPHGGTSLFVFAWVDTPLGGPPCFCVTGLSAGFGYNRALRIPAQGEVQTFPLVAGLSDQAAIGGTRPPAGDPTAPQPPPTPGAALESIGGWAPIEQGEYWLAAGVQFTTFEILQTSALLVVEFGRDLVVAVLGTSTLQQPAEGPTLVYAELGIEVAVRPQQGELSASGVLAPGSYVLTPSAVLSGGFSFAAWWGDNEHAGDFAFTIGGYHPAFEPPEWYPQEPRLSIDWQVGGGVAVLGSAYFAITPAAMMAGSSLAVTFEAGPLEAWLKSQTDAMIRWKPFYLVAEDSISVGVSFHLHLLFVDVTISAELGARFTLWGPPIGFAAHVDWYVISFTVEGGAGQGGAGAMTWEELKGMLPSKTQITGGGEGGFDAGAEPSQTTPAYLQIAAASGLLRSALVAGERHWLMRPARLALLVSSAIPASKVVLQDEEGERTLGEMGGVGIRGVQTPAGVGVPAAAYQSLMAVALRRYEKGKKPKEMPLAPGSWTGAATVQAMPKAIWGEPLAGDAPPVTEPQGPTVAAQVGATIRAQPRPITDATPEMKIVAVFEELTELSAPIAISPTATASAPSPRPGEAFKALKEAADPARPPAANRTALFEALQRLGVDPGTDGDLSAMAEDPGRAFADEPLLAAAR